MTALDDLHKYFLISEMFVAPSYYWAAAHGAAPGEVLRDAEAVSVLTNLGRNMAWMMSMKRDTAVALPPPDPFSRAWMNFIRD